MTTALAVVLLAAALACAADYRRGLVIIAAVGLLQDLVRKLADGQPTYLMGLVFFVFAATLVGALATENPRWWRRRDWHGLGRLVALFWIVLFVQALVSYMRVGSLVLIGIGFAAYVGPLAALALGSWAGTHRGVIQRFLGAYVFFVAAMASGIAFYQAGFRWKTLMSVGPGLTVYDWQLGAIYLPPGFFRAPEVAAWHCATAVCVAILLAAALNASPARWAVLGGVATFLCWCVVATGRRKAIGEIVVFLSVFAFLQVWLRGRFGKLAGVVLAIVLFGGFAFQHYGLKERAAVQIGSMEERSETAGGASGRFLGSVVSLPRIVEVAGFLGTGLGTGTQGGQHFRVGAEDWSIISESGLARVVAELGVPGAVVGLLLLIRFVLNLRGKVLSLPGGTGPDKAILLGLLALVGANAVVFVSAHQIFGDPFVYLFLGLSVGFIVAELDAEQTAEWRRRSEEPRAVAA